MSVAEFAESDPTDRSAVVKIKSGFLSKNMSRIESKNQRLSNVEGRVEEKS